MRKWIILLIIIAGVVGAWWYVKTYVKVVPEWRKPKLAKITRGDIRVPITASGLIEPKQRIEVKSKASGEVTQVFIEEGDFVRRGEKLVVLDPDDEQRSVQRARADLDRAEAQLAQAKLAVKQAEVNVLSRQAQHRELKAMGELRAFTRDRVREQQERGAASPVDLINSQAQYEVNLAQQEAALAAIETAELSVADANQVVITSAAAVEVARTTLGDAEERLEETEVIAQHDALVTDVNVTESSIIQAGQSTFTGGTVIAQLADISQLKVVARVDEAEYGRVMAIAPQSALPEMRALEEAEQRGAEEIEQRSGAVKITVDAFPEETFAGMIDRVEPQGRLQSGASVIQYDVHVLITDANRYKLLLGSQAQVEFTVESAVGVLRVPADAVKAEGEQRGVYIETPPPEGSTEQWGKKFVPCVFGITDGSYTEVAQVIGHETLTEGQKVYTKLPPDADDDRD